MLLSMKLLNWKKEIISAAVIEVLSKKLTTAIRSMIFRIEDCLFVGVWLDCKELEGILHIGHQPVRWPAILPVVGVG